MTAATKKTAPRGTDFEKMNANQLKAYVMKAEAERKAAESKAAEWRQNIKTAKQFLLDLEARQYTDRFVYIARSTNADLDKALDTLESILQSQTQNVPQPALDKAGGDPAQAPPVEGATDGSSDLVMPLSGSTPNPIETALGIHQ